MGPLDSPGATLSTTRPQGTTAQKAAWAVPLAVPVVAAIWFGGIWIMLVVCVAAGLGAAEFFEQASPGGRPSAWKFWRLASFVFGAGIPILGWIRPGAYWAILIAGTLALAITSLDLLWGSRRFTVATRSWDNVFACLEGSLMIGALLGCLVPVAASENGRLWVVLIVAFNFSSDIFSSICGKVSGSMLNRHFGADREKIFKPPCPRISPHKTRIGFVGGFVCTVVIGAGLYFWLSDVRILWLALAIAVAAPMGDLFGSALKRSLRIKDWSNLLGPHGGLGDRLDSFLFSAPAGYLVLACASVVPVWSMGS